MSQSDQSDAASVAAEHKEGAETSVSSSSPRPSHLRVGSSAAATSASTFTAAASSPRAAAAAADSSSSSSGSSPSASSSASSSPVAYRRALQSIRAQDLEQEAVLTAHQIAAEDAFWAAQEERLNQCVKRAQVGASSARDLHTYLKRSSKLLTGVAESLTSLGSFGVAGETGTMRVACMSIDIVRKSTGSYLSELNGRVFSESIKAAADTADHAQSIATAYEGVGVDALKHLKAARKSAHDAWNAYMADTRERHRAEVAGRPLKSDPFLLCRAYEHERYELDTSQSKFAAIMATLLRDLEQSEAKRIALTKTTLLDNLQANSAVLSHAVKFTENALLTVKAIDPAGDIQEFVTSADLYLPPSAAPPPSAASAATAASLSAASSRSAANNPDALLAHSETARAADALAKETPLVAFLAPPPARDPRALARLYAHEIEKEGPLERQGSIMKSHWKPVHAVLTASCFIHLFRDKTKQKLHSSHSLSDCSVEAADAAHPQCIKLTFAAKGGLFSSPTVVFLKAANDDEQMEWVTQIQKYATHPPQPIDAAAAGAAAASNGSAPSSPVAGAAPAPASVPVPATAEHQQPSVVATATDADT